MPEHPHLPDVIISAFAARCLTASGIRSDPISAHSCISAFVHLLCASASRRRVTPARRTTEPVPKRWRRAPAPGCRRCTRKPTGWRRKSGRCSAIFAARARAADQAEERRAAGCRKRPICERELPTLTERLDQLQNEEVADAADLEARLVESTSWGRRGMRGCCCRRPTLGDIGQAARMVAALARSRSRPDRRAPAAARPSFSISARRSKNAAALARSAPGRRARAPRPTCSARRRHAALPSRSIDRQRDLNAAACRRAARRRSRACRPSCASCPEGGGPDRRARLPIKPFQGDLDWPAAGAVRPGSISPRPAARSRRTASRSRPSRALTCTAVHDGVVAFADPFSGFGNLVILDHGAQTFSLYGNLLDIAVQKGMRVSAGQPVGTVGRPCRAGRAVLRVARRRSAGRSFTMAQETVTAEADHLRHGALNL